MINDDSSLFVESTDPALECWRKFRRGMIQSAAALEEMCMVFGFRPRGADDAIRMMMAIADAILRQDKVLSNEHRASNKAINVSDSQPSV